MAVRNSNHFGTAAYFTRMAARDGCVAILTTNASPAMAPWGGRRKTVGTNPWSIAAPAGRHDVMVMDIANTAVARGKVYLATAREPIPSGWAIDADGAPTTDPAAAIAGVILPMAGHKGYAISLMMDVLSGVLTGSAFGAAVSGPYQFERRSGCGHLFVALDVAAFGDPDGFTRRMEQLVAEVRSAPLAQGFDEVFYPGELEDRAAREHLEQGLSFPGRPSTTSAGLPVPPACRRCDRSGSDRLDAGTLAATWPGGPAGPGRQGPPRRGRRRRPPWPRRRRRSRRPHAGCRPAAAAAPAGGGVRQPGDRVGGRGQHAVADPAGPTTATPSPRPGKTSALLGWAIQ